MRWAKRISVPRVESRKSGRRPQCGCLLRHKPILWDESPGSQLGFDQRYQPPRSPRALGNEMKEKVLRNFFLAIFAASAVQFLLGACGSISRDKNRSKALLSGAGRRMHRIALRTIFGFRQLTTLRTLTRGKVIREKETSRLVPMEILGACEGHSTRAYLDAGPPSPGGLFSSANTDTFGDHPGMGSGTVAPNSCTRACAWRRTNFQGRGAAPKVR